MFTTLFTWFCISFIFTYLPFFHQDFTFFFIIKYRLSDVCFYISHLNNYLIYIKKKIKKITDVIDENSAVFVVNVIADRILFYCGNLHT